MVSEIKPSYRIMLNLRRFLGIIAEYTIDINFNIYLLIERGILWV